MLVRLKDNKGNVMFLNPGRILLVAGSVANGAAVIGEAAVVLDNGATLAVSGTPEEINDILSGKTPAKKESKLFPIDKP